MIFGNGYYERAGYKVYKTGVDVCLNIRANAV